jgi:hypothetical protein
MSFKSYPKIANLRNAVLDMNAEKENIVIGPTEFHLDLTEKNTKVLQDWIETEEKYVFASMNKSIKVHSVNLYSPD